MVARSTSAKKHRESASSTLLLRTSSKAFCGFQTPQSLRNTSFIAKIPQSISSVCLSEGRTDTPIDHSFTIFHNPAEAKYFSTNTELKLFCLVTKDDVNAFYHWVKWVSQVMSTKYRALWKQRDIWTEKRDGQKSRPEYVKRGREVLPGQHYPIWSFPHSGSAAAPVNTENSLSAAVQSYLCIPLM